MIKYPNLERVTFTGADDSTLAEDILRVVKKYPKTEWGILFGGGKLGGARFPSEKWILNEVPKLRDAGAQLCAHLCGTPMIRLCIYGQDIFSQIVELGFKRVQLNFHGQKFYEAMHPDFNSVIDAYAGVLQFIFQADGVNDQLRGEGFAHRVPLFDVSHGAGVLPDGGWPKRYAPQYMGYAGGLGPKNIVEQLAFIDKAAGDYGPYWIDMETKVRSLRDRMFDLDKVRNVCEQIWG